MGFAGKLVSSSIIFSKKQTFFKKSLKVSLLNLKIPRSLLFANFAQPKGMEIRFARCSMKALRFSDAGVFLTCRWELAAEIEAQVCKPSYHLHTTD